MIVLLLVRRGFLSRPVSPQSRDRGGRSGRAGAPAAAAIRVRAAAQRRDGAQAAAARRGVGSGSRRALAGACAEDPTNPLPFSRGNTPERVEGNRASQAARGEGRRRARREAAPREPTRRWRSAGTGRLGLPTKPPTPQRPLTGVAVARRRAGRSPPEPGPLRAARSVREPQGGAVVRARDSVRHQGRRVRAVDPPVRRAGQAQLVDSRTPRCR